LASALSTAFLADALRRYPPSPRYWVAFSGGLDSTVLLHLCHTLQREPSRTTFAAAHIHHGLHGHAHQWATFCSETCLAWGIPLQIRYVDARHAAGDSPEEAARKARYAALSELIGPDETLLTAQHQDDQAETLLLQLFRGAGPAGLAGMPEWTGFGQGYLARPLLGFRRRDLHRYARNQRLQWIDDPSNEEVRFDRNYLRHEILPALEKRWPGFAGTLSRSAKHCAEADDLLRELGHQLLIESREPARNTLIIEALCRHSAARQRLILREWLRAGGYRQPSSAIIERVLRELLLAGAGRQPEVCWSAGQIKRFRGELYLLKRDAPFDGGRVTAWDGAAPLRLNPDNGTLSVHLLRGPGIDLQRWRQGPISVRYRQGGETLRLPNRAGTRALKKLLQEADVPPWERGRMPLIYIGHKLAAVADRWIDAAFSGDPAATNVRLNWEPALLG
jgi:tRNA(Ile)-lysidine synthase